MATIRRTSILFIKNQTNPIVVCFVLFSVICYRLGAFEGEYFVLLVLAFLLTGQLMDNVDLESNNKTYWKSSVIAVCMQWFLVVGLLLLVGFASKTSEHFSREVILSWFFLTPVILVITQLFLRRLLLNVSLNKKNCAKAVVIGLNDLSASLINELHRNPLIGIDSIGYFDDRSQDRLDDKVDQQNCPYLGNIKQAPAYAKTHHIQHIYIALPMTAQPRIQSLLEELHDTTASIYFIPDIFLFDLIQANISTIRGIPVIAICETPFTGINGLSKRLSDILISLMILLLVSPILLLIALGVKLTSPGPVLFKQRRYGLDGEEIIVYKFRSMTVCEDGGNVPQAQRNDPRITHFGAFLRKTSLDELPQFLNVIQGRMSIVGPRPHAVSHNELYRKLIKGYMIRHKVKPGITGWAQVNGYRGETDIIEKMQGRIEYDLDYLRNWSLFLDLLIIFKTIGIVVKDKNAY